MNINARKRIGEVVIVAEGEIAEFEIIKKIFNNLLGYSVYSKRRNQLNFIQLEGHDADSRVLLLNAPTNNLSCLKDAKSFYDFLYTEISQKFDVDLFNDSTYILFDRDRLNNPLRVVKKLVKVFTASQNDEEEQNGLLLLSYPSIEAFEISAFENNSFNNTFKLGSEAKTHVETNGYDVGNLCEENLKHATDEFINYLIKEGIIGNADDIVRLMGEIGEKVLEKQTKKCAKDQVFNCVSQLVQILIDLDIITF